MLNSSGCILSYILIEKQSFLPHVRYVEKKPLHLTLTAWQDEVILSTWAKKSSLFPGFYATFCLFLLQKTWICPCRRNSRWLTTVVWIPMVFLFYSCSQNPFIPFYCIKVDQIKALLELQSFIAPHFPFCSLIFHRWYPASVPLKRCLSWQPCLAVF